MLDAQSADQLRDGQLLERFAAQRDEEAFAALVRRHGPLVLSVCRRRLKDGQEAEDVFQATFLVLARKAGSIRQQDSVSSWLYGVASRLAGKVNVHAARRRIHERRAAPMTQPDPPTEMSWREVCALLEEELSRLPEKYRAPVVSCYLEGNTQEEAAAQLGWPRGTLKRRLERARELLRQRLDRRGVALSAALGVTLLGQNAARALPDALVAQTVRAASGFVLSPATTEAAPALAVRLAEGLLRARFLSTLRLALVIGLAASLLVGGAVSVTHPVVSARQPRAEPEADRPATVKEQAPLPHSDYPAYTDRYEAPLPYRLIARS